MQKESMNIAGDRDTRETDAVLAMSGLEALTKK